MSCVYLTVMYFLDLLYILGLPAVSHIGHGGTYSQNHGAVCYIMMFPVVTFKGSVYTTQRIQVQMCEMHSVFPCSTLCDRFTTHLAVQQCASCFIVSLCVRVWSLCECLCVPAAALRYQSAIASLICHFVSLVFSAPRCLRVGFECGGVFLCVRMSVSVSRAIQICVCSQVCVFVCVHIPKRDWKWVYFFCGH